MIDIGIDTDPVVKQYGGMVLKIAKQYSSDHPQDFGDYVQAGMLGLYRALSTYKDGKSSKVTWLYIHIRNEIQKAKNSKLMVKVSPATAAKYSLSITNIDGLPEQINDYTPYDSLANEETERQKAKKLQSVWKKMNKKFSSVECQVLIDYYANNLSVRQIQKQLHVSVHPIIKRAQDMISSGMFLLSSSTSSGL